MMDDKEQINLWVSIKDKKEVEEMAKKDKCSMSNMYLYLIALGKQQYETGKRI